ncbi:MAG TPA: cysteine desulfurase family protein [Planctomycetota bacterium]|nr:cysteine desulfurase family protein [Planctomycetota bacterium]
MGDERYFDTAASCPPFPEALRRFEEVSAGLYGNPSSTHGWGRRAHEELEAAREGLLARLGFSQGSLVLTSGATEANNLVLRSALDAHPQGRLLLAVDVHDSAWFARDLYPGRVDLLETGPDGRLSPERLESRLTRKTVLVSLLHVNNETGTIHDLRALGDVCARRKVPLHCDGVQAVGHVPLGLDGLPFESYTFSAHKFGGPRGVGGVLVRGERPAPLLRGGGQEAGARSGTENVAGLSAAGVALEMSVRSLEGEVPRLRRLARALVDLVPEAIVNSEPEHGLPGLVSLSFPGLIGENLVAEMTLRGFAISAGSACGSGKMEPSRPVLAMGRTREQALGTVRLSMGRHTTPESVRDLAATLREAVERQRALA